MHYSEIMLTRPVDSLAPTILNLLAEGLTPLTALGFMYDLTQVTPSLAQDVRNHVVPAERLRIVLGHEQEPVAFIASAVKETALGRLYELEGIIIHPDQQGKRLGKSLLIDELRRTHARLLGFQTQNQRMFDLGLSVAQPDTELALQLGREIGTPSPVLRRTERGDDVAVHAKRYGGESLYRNVDQFMKDGKEIDGLKTFEGDALVFIGKIKEEICNGENPYNSDGQQVSDYI